MPWRRSAPPLRHRITTPEAPITPLQGWSYPPPEVPIPPSGGGEAPLWGWSYHPLEVPFTTPKGSDFPQRSGDAPVPKGFRGALASGHPHPRSPGNTRSGGAPTTNLGAGALRLLFSERGRSDHRSRSGGAPTTAPEASGARVPLRDHPPHRGTAPSGHHKWYPPPAHFV